MDRREALRILAGGAAIPLVPSSLLAALRKARALAAVDSAPRTLNSHQFTTVKTMAELILPRTDTPGAADAGAAEFADLILTEWYDENQRTRFLTGLAAVDSRSQTLFAKDFVESSPTQQAEILTALGEEMEAEADAKLDKAIFSEWKPEEETSFYPMLRWLTLTAYYTSEDGATRELNFQIIPDRHAGCVEIPSGKGDQPSQ
jgi:glucoside 3-dehydrogenase (cytochrome c) hitch-hiker subunit